MTQSRTTINAATVKALQASLVRQKYSSQMCQIDECIICLEKFQENRSIITNLSHNKNHVFHTKCLEEWIKKSQVCPMCRTEINAKEEEKYKKKVKN